MADYVSISDKIAEINDAYKEKDLERYRQLLGKLSEVLNPNDPILKIYNIRLSELTLRND